jgi:gamma-glutamylputrescine oxidase
MHNKLNYSFWELDYYAQADIVIVGGGIVGINAAISIKQAKPKLKVLVVEERWQGGGASVKNAGFVCFGSPTEMLDDIKHYGEDYAINIFAKRYEGAKKLLERVQPSAMQYSKVGGVEVYDDKLVSSDQHEYLNQLVYKAIGYENYFKIGTQTISPKFSTTASLMSEEASINPKLMMEALYTKAIDLGVKFLMTKVVDINCSNHEIFVENGIVIKYQQLGLANNSFVQNLIPSYKIKPARNLVLVTEALQNISFTEVAHFDRGFVYFRRIGNRILIGGGRNIEIDHEFSDKLEVNENIKNYLLQFLIDKVLNGQKVSIEHIYIGILGFTEEEFATIKKYDSSTWIASGLGGMGVAIGTKMGEDLASEMLR